MGLKVTASGRIGTRIWDEQASTELAGVGIAAIDERTFVRGQNLEDQAFPPHSASVALKRVSLLQAAKVDLVETGELRKAVQESLTDPNDDGFRLVLDGDQGAKAEGLQQKRPFFGFSPKDREQLEAALPGIVAGAMDRSRRGR